jgi:hypothetical protein
MRHLNFKFFFLPWHYTSALFTDYGNWESIVGIVIRLQAERSKSGFPASTKDFYLLLNVETISLAQLASYSMGIRGCFTGCKVVGV